MTPRPGSLGRRGESGVARGGSAQRAGLLWLVPLLLTAHNVEEGLTIGPFLAPMQERLPQALQGLVPEITLPRFLAALGDLRSAGSRAAYALLAVQATLLLNVLSHAGAAIRAGGYVPGLATALILNLPFSLVLLRRAWTERWFSRRGLLALAPIALLLHGPGLLALFALVGALV